MLIGQKGDDTAERSSIGRDGHPWGTKASLNHLTPVRMQGFRWSKSRGIAGVQPERGQAEPRPVHEQ